MYFLQQANSESWLIYEGKQMCSDADKWVIVYLMNHNNTYNNTNSFIWQWQSVLSWTSCLREEHFGGSDSVSESVSQSVSQWVSQWEEPQAVNTVNNNNNAPGML